MRESANSSWKTDRLKVLSRVVGNRLYITRKSLRVASLNQARIAHIWVSGQSASHTLEYDKGSPR